jgi:hypothetical protein
VKDRRHLTYYVATMIARVPAARVRATSFIPGALASVAADVKKAIEEAARLGLIDEQAKVARLAEAERVSEKHRKQTPMEITKVIETPWPFESWLVAIYNMTWRVVECNGTSYYLTSDNPVTLLGEEGLAVDSCEFTFPLAKDLMLHCSWQGDGVFERRPSRGPFVKECNRRTAFYAHRFIFYHEEASWVLELALNQSPKLNRINWR